jgi:hypothetical protein
VEESEAIQATAVCVCVCVRACLLTQHVCVCLRLQRSVLACVYRYICVCACVSRINTCILGWWGAQNGERELRWVHERVGLHANSLMVVLPLVFLCLYVRVCVPPCPRACSICRMRAVVVSRAASPCWACPALSLSCVELMGMQRRRERTRRHQMSSRLRWWAQPETVGPLALHYAWIQSLSAMCSVHTNAVKWKWSSGSKFFWETRTRSCARPAPGLASTGIRPCAAGSHLPWFYSLSPSRLRWCWKYKGGLECGAWSACSWARARAGNYFSTVLYIAAIYRRCTRALTFQKLEWAGADSTSPVSWSAAQTARPISRSYTRTHTHTQIRTHIYTNTYIIGSQRSRYLSSSFECRERQCALRTHCITK